MAAYEYRAVAAPRRVKKIRGVKEQDARMAMTFEDLIQENAAEGWEYMRADTFPIEEKKGFFSRARETRRAVMVFRRPAEHVSALLHQETRDRQPAAAAPAPQATQPQPQPENAHAAPQHAPARVEPTVAPAGEAADEIGCREPAPLTPEPDHRHGAAPEIGGARREE